MPSGLKENSTYQLAKIHQEDYFRKNIWWLCLNLVMKKVVLLDFLEIELVHSGAVHWIPPAPHRAGGYFWIKLNFLPETFPDSH